WRGGRVRDCPHVRPAGRSTSRLPALVPGCVMRFPPLPTRRCVAPMRSTTYQLRALYPLVAESPIAAGGVLLGTDEFGAAWHFDAFRYYRADVVQDPNVFVAGSIGAGKSGLVIEHGWRQLAFGRWWWVVDS